MNYPAKFHPGEYPSNRPAIEVAGVYVFTYIDADGKLIVSIHLEDADPAIVDADYIVPMEVTISGETVYDSGGSK